MFIKERGDSNEIHFQTEKVDLGKVDFQDGSLLQ